VHGLDLWPILVLFGVISLVIATCVSHTVAAVLIVPIAAEVGGALEVPHPRLLIMVRRLRMECVADRTGHRARLLRGVRLACLRLPCVRAQAGSG